MFRGNLFEIIHDSDTATSPMAQACEIASGLVKFFSTRQQNPAKIKKKELWLEGCDTIK